MERVGVPTAQHQSFTDNQAASTYIREQGAPIVVKASGLAAGKGAVVCHSVDQALAAAHEMLDEDVLGGAGHHIVVEEYMTGEEASLFAICDGEHFITLTPAQDHKPIYDGDKGPNTGGMGAYAPAPVMTPDPSARSRGAHHPTRPRRNASARHPVPRSALLRADVYRLRRQSRRVQRPLRRFPNARSSCPCSKPTSSICSRAACDGRLDQVASRMCIRGGSLRGHGLGRLSAVL